VNGLTLSASTETWENAKVTTGNVYLIRATMLLGRWLNEMHSDGTEFRAASWSSRYHSVNDELGAEETRTSAPRQLQRMGGLKTAGAKLQRLPE